MFDNLKTLWHSEKFIKNISIAIFFGSLWGIVEATLGYLLHKINFGLGWCIWFPLAFYFLDRIYKKTKKADFMMYGAVIASIIKLTNLFIETRVDKVINPAASIIIEAAALFAFYKAVEKHHRKLGLKEIAIINILWRYLYSVYILLMPTAFASISPLRDLSPFLHFMILESAVNTLIIVVYVIGQEKVKMKKGEVERKVVNIKLLPSLAVFAVAIVLQWIV